MNAGAERQRLDEVVASYGEAYAPFDAAMRGYMMRTLAPHFRDGPCLQVGCAHGDETSHLAERFGDLTVLEPVRVFLDNAAARAPASVRFVEGLVEDFETDRRFEAIFFSHVLEHVEDPVACLQRLGELLSPTGRLFVVAPNAEAASRRIAVKMGVLEHLESLSAADLAAGHRRVYRLDTLVADARRASLGIVDTGGVFFKPLANFQFDALMGGPLIGEAFMDGCYELGKEHPTFCASIYLVAERRAA